jgi:hypothetical protein
MSGSEGKRVQLAALRRLQQRFQHGGFKHGSHCPTRAIARLSTLYLSVLNAAVVKRLLYDTGILPESDIPVNHDQQSILRAAAGPPTKPFVHLCKIPFGPAMPRSAD